MQLQWPYWNSSVLCIVIRIHKESPALIRQVGSMELFVSDIEDDTVYLLVPRRGQEDFWSSGYSIERFVYGGAGCLLGFGHLWFKSKFERTW